MANIFGNVISDFEGRDGSFIVRQIRSAVPSDQKVTNSRHMMAPKLGFSPGLKAKGPGAVIACVPAIPARSDAARRNFYRPVDHDWHKKQRTMGKVTIFFFYLRGSFKCMIVILPTF